MIRKIVVLSLLLFLILVVIIKFSPRSNQEQDQRFRDAIVLNQKGDSLKNFKPEEALTYFDQAIALFNQCHPEEKIQSQIALVYLDKALIYSNSGNYPLALHTDSIAIIIADKIDDKQIKAKLLLSKGTIQYHQGNFDQAALTYQSAMKIALAINDYKTQTKILSNLAILDYHKGDIEKTIYAFNKALKIGQKHHDDEIMASSYMNLAIVYNSKSENDSVIGYYIKARALYKKTNDKNGEILCFQNLGNLYYDISDFKSAIENYQNSVNLAIEMDDKSNIAKGYHNLAEVYSYLGDNQKATELLFKSLKIKEQVDDQLSLAKGYTSIGGLYFNQGVYEKSEYYYRKSLRLCQQLNCVNEIASNYSNIGNIFSARSQRDSAVFYYQNALKLYEQSENLFAASNIHITLGVEYTLKHNYPLAEKNLLLALKEKQELEDRKGEALSHYYLAKLSYNKSINNQFTNTKFLLREGESSAKVAYAIGQKLNALPIMRDVTEILKEIYKKQHEPQKALYYSEQFNTLSDSILNRAKIEALTFAEARWNIENKEKQINHLEEEKKSQQALLESRIRESKQQKIIIIFGSILISLTLLFIVFIILYNRKRRNILYQNQLNQLTQMKMRNIRNRMSPHFIFNMLSSVSHESEEVREKIHHISMLLRETIENSERTAISLEEEISIVQRYVDLQRDKIPQPFQFKVQIDSSINPKMLIPAMILQIPVENAIKHGLMPMVQGQSHLTIIAKKSDGINRISIYDNGVGLSHRSQKTAGTGNGLKMVLQMIQIFNANNKNKIEFTIADRNEYGGTTSGTMVQITIPQDYSYNTNIIN